MNLGALAERNFRLLFSSTTVSGLGDGVATIALAFAVLQVSSSPVALGLVLAGRQAAQAAIVLAAGVWADRLPRHLVLIGAAAVQGAAQAACGVLMLEGHATVPLLAALQIVYGLGQGFVIPAGVGLVPATVSSLRLQDANALLGLSRSGAGVIGPAAGGVLVALGSPGGALLVDAASFAAAAFLLVLLRLAPRTEAAARQPFLAELRAGWSEFRRQTWLWTSIVFFGIGNFVSASVPVLGPVVAERYLGGARAWATIVSAFALGSVLGGLLSLRLRPSRPLVVSVAAAALFALEPVGIALLLPVWVIAAVAFLCGIGLAVHLALWMTVFQQQVPEESRSRVSSYDSLGSFVLVPLGAALAGPVAALVGIRATLLGAAVVDALCIAVVLAQPSVRAIRAGGPQPEAAGAP